VEASVNSLFPGRVLAWFSCGAASAVAAKLMVEAEPERTEVCCCNTLAYEHPDNRRFLADVERWIGRPVTMLNSKRFADIYDVFEREQFLRGPGGAPCTKHLKRQVRRDYQGPGDVHTLGYTVEEKVRIDLFHLDNPDVETRFILAERGITKSECYRIVRMAGIELPAMYLLGYKNNNCIGCVKGGAGYWNKIRRDFPESFWRMAKLERRIGFALLKVKGKPCFLDELPEGVGRYDDEPDIECGPHCSLEPAAA
jgi:hypothetical protein